MKSNEKRKGNNNQATTKMPTEKRGASLTPLQNGKWWKNRNTVLLLLAVLVITWVVISPNLKADFVNWDDDENVYKNENVTSFNVHGIFTTPVIGNYNPLTNLTFAAEYHLFKEQPFYYHLDNNILHLINTFLVFILILLLGMQPVWALFVALLFGIHPMHVESVSWVTERKDVLFGMFYLLSAVCYLLHFKTRKISYLALTYLFFILSLFSKIQAVSLPLTLLLFDYLLQRPLKIKLIIEKIPYFLLSLGVGLLGIYFLRKQGSIDPNVYSFVERILMGTYTLCVYLAKALVPYEMSTIYPYPKTGEFEWFYYITPFILIALGYLVYRTIKHTRAVAFGVLFFLVNVIFVIQVVSAGQGFIADRFTYIPYIGIFYVFAFALSRLYEQRAALKPVIIGFTLIVSLVYAGIARSHTAVWKNTETLFTYVLDHHKNVATAYWNRGNYYRDHKIIDKAIADYSYLLKIKPLEGPGYISRGKLYFDTKEFDKALDDFNIGLKYDPQNKDGYSNRAGIYTMRQQFDLAMQDINKALSLDPTMKNGYRNRAIIYFNRNDYENTIKDLDSYLTMVPDDAAVFDMRGLCKFRLKKYDAALQDFNTAIGLKADMASFYENRSLALWKTGNKPSALEDVKKAQQLGSKITPAVLESLDKEK